jgi:chromosome segregation ATPase
VISPHVDSSQKLSSLIRHFLSGPERTALAANVGELLRHDDITGAQQMLSAAVDRGSFALLISDDIQDPELQEALRAIAREYQDTRISQEGRAAKQGNAAEKERERAESAIHELQAVQEQLTALRENDASKDATIVKLEHALEQEKGQTASAIQNLSFVQEQLAEMTRNAIRAADARDEYAREVEHAKAALSKMNIRLTEAQGQLTLTKGPAADAAALRAALEQERDATRFATAEIESLKREIVKLQTTKVRSNGAASSTAQEKERGDSASQQLGAERDQLPALRESGAKMPEELKQEKGRSASVARELMASQKEIAVLKAQAAGAAAIQEALRQEKESTAAALREVQNLKTQMAALEPRAQLVPAALLFQANPVLLKTFRIFEDGAKPSSRSGTAGEVSLSKARQASLPPRAETEHKSTNEALPQTHRRNFPQKTAEEKSDRSPSEVPKLTEMADRNTVVKPKRSPRLPARAASTPRLPATLLPVDGLWAFY